MNRTPLAIAALLLAAVSVWRASGPDDGPSRTSPAPPRPSEQSRSDDALRRIDAVVAAYFTGRAAATFGGSFVDEATGGTVVLVTADTDTVRRDLVSRLPAYADLLTVRRAQFALSDLTRIVDTLTERRLPSTVAVAVDEAANRVVVSVLTDTPAVRHPVLRVLSPSDRRAVTFETASAPVLE